MALLETGRGEEEKLRTKELVIVISDTEEASDMNKQSEYSKGFAPFESGLYSFSENLRGQSPNGGSTELQNLQIPPPEITLNNTPKVAYGTTAVQRRSKPRPAYFKPKSRLVEPPYPSGSKVVEEGTQMVPVTSSYRKSPKMASPANRSTASTPKEYAKTGPVTPKTTAPVTPRTPLMVSPGGEDDEDEAEDDDDQVYKTANIKQYEGKRGKKVKMMILFEWIVLICMKVFLITSLTIPRLRNLRLWSLEIWKWCVLVVVIFCGRLFTEWFINLLVFLIEKNFLLKKKVLYFVYGLKWSVRVFIWLGLVLLAWGLLINRGVRRSKETTKVLNYITRALASSLIGAAMWMVKTLLVKLLASSFHVKTFFDRIQESIFHQYVLRTLSGPPLMEDAEKSSSWKSGQLSFKNPMGGKQEKEEVIDVDKLHKMKPEKVSAWTMGGLIKVIGSSGLFTISEALEEIVDDEGVEEKEITSELEAKAAARFIFRNVAKRGNKFIDEDDLLRFMTSEEVDNVLPLLEGSVETGQIKKSSLRNWVVKAYNERKYLAHSLNDAKTAIEDLNKIASGIVFILIIFVWLLLMGIATTNVLIFISSQLLLWVFMFGNTLKTVFEAIVFVFVMHPFDVGDRCVIDGVQMVVDEVNILTTIFLRYDNEKIYYPNAVLATRPISNFNRSPEMSDSVEFAVDVSTSIESIVALKAKIKAYLESKPQHWRSGHSVQVTEIEDVNKMKMGLYVTHTTNFQNYGEKSNRKSDLVLELKKIFEELGIKYHLLPQEVHVTYVGSAPPTNTTVTR
ncbi:unnamed protein product [Ilex paraguariensis]|uniref:EF-hand domain-containing protein n=1 Tax=Ilex paraguariensis TaxID=185542 RepID=A0ABC8UBY1_9AQUA